MKGKLRFQKWKQKNVAGWYLYIVPLNFEYNAKIGDSYDKLFL